MKTIEKAAEEYAKGLNYSLEAKHNMCQEDFVFAFRKGAKFAQRWIPVTEELPEIKDEEYTIYTKFTSPYGVIHYGSMYIKKAKDVDCLRRNFTHWRPINIE